MTDINVTITETANAEARAVALSGELDEVSVDTVKAQLDTVINDTGVKYLILDFTDLSFINSKGIGFLVWIHTHLAKEQRQLMLVAANEAVMDVISLVGLPTIVPYHKDVEEALANLNA